jgi:Uma2 family endonuclease
MRLFPKEFSSSKSVSQLGRESNGLLMTPNEFLAIEEYDERFRYELVRGVVVVSRNSNDAEVDLSDELNYWLRSYQENHPQGAALDGTLYERHIRTEMSVRRVGRVIYTGLNRQPSSRRDTPSIIVDFVPHSRKALLRDYIVRRDEFLEVGVKEYWVINYSRCSMTVFFPAPAEPAFREINGYDTYTTPLLPGFDLPFGKLMRLVDHLS